MEHEVKVGERIFKVKELKYNEIASMDMENKPGLNKNIMLLSTGMSEEEYNNLTVKEGLTIMNTVNELNGLQDFINPQTTKSKTS